MFRFYVKRVGDEYQVLNSHQFAGKDVYTEDELYGCKAPFAEIRITSGMKVMDVVAVDELDVPDVKPEALKAADDHNITVIFRPKDEEPNRKNTQELRESFQEFIDRAQLYGPTFESEFEKLLQQFPVKVEIKDNFYRQVSK